MFSFLHYKKAIAILLIIPILFLSAPRQTDAFVGPVVVVTVVIVCIVVGCGPGTRNDGDSGGNNRNSCSSREGRTCYSRGNYCGQKSRGRYTCSGSCNAGTPPPNTNCNNYPLSDNALIFDKDIVRDGDDVNIQWNLGRGNNTNWPPNCTLVGPKIDVSLTRRDAQGSVTVTATGPHTYTLTCGTQSVSKTLRILPTLYES